MVLKKKNQYAAISAAIAGLDGWATPLPFAPVHQGYNIFFHQSPRDYLRLRIQMLDSAEARTGAAYRNPPGGLGPGALRVCIEQQPLPVTSSCVDEAARVTPFATWTH